MIEILNPPTWKQRLVTGAAGALVVGGSALFLTSHTTVDTPKGEGIKHVIANPEAFEKGLHDAGVPITTGIGAAAGFAISISMLEAYARRNESAGEQK